jgi:hypothetical protein
MWLFYSTARVQTKNSDQLNIPASLCEHKSGISMEPSACSTTGFYAAVCARSFKAVSSKDAARVGLRFGENRKRDVAVFGSCD